MVMYGMQWYVTTSDVLCGTKDGTEDGYSGMVHLGGWLDRIHG